MIRRAIVRLGLLTGTASRARKLLSAALGMVRTRGLPSAHAPLHGGPPIAEFDAFKEPPDDDDHDEIPLRVAARFAALPVAPPRNMTLPMERWNLTTSAVVTTLRAHGHAVDEVRFTLGAWPGQVGIVGLRRGVPSLWGAVVVDVTVESDEANAYAEIRIEADDDPVEGA